MDARLSKGGTVRYYTSESTDRFREQATLFIGEMPKDIGHWE